MSINLLFDLDGTIIEPQEGILNSIRHAAQKMGVEIPATTEMHQFIGPPIMDSFQSKLSLNYEDAMEAVSYFRKYYRTTGIHQHQLFHYVEQLLNNLKAKGYNFNELIEYFKVFCFSLCLVKQSSAHLYR